MRLLETLRADEGLDERPAVGIGITLRGEAGENGRPADEGRGEEGRPGDEGRKVSGREFNGPTDKVLKDISNGGVIRTSPNKSTFYEYSKTKICARRREKGGNFPSSTWR